MYPSIFLEAWIVFTPESIHSIRFFNNGLDHFGLVMREVVRNIQHDITDEISYSGDAVRCDVFESKMVDSWVVIGLGVDICIFQGKSRPPINGENHDPSMIWTNMRPYRLAVEFHINLPSKGIDGMSKVEAFHPLGELLTDPMND